MKHKIFLLLFAIVASMNVLFASPTTVPIVSDLTNAGYNVSSNVVLCCYFDDAPCTDVIMVGTYNNWSATPSECVHFSVLAGFAGWYVAEAPYETGFQAKPVHLHSDGSFSWNYQVGDQNAWIYKNGEEATIEAGYDNEANVYFYGAGAYIYEIAYWKNHHNPCSLVSHNYTIELYAPNACPEMTPAVIGDFPNNSWQNNIPMTLNNGVYSVNISAIEGSEFKFREAEDTNWSNQLLVYDSEDDKWYAISNLILPDTIDDLENVTVTYDYSNNSKYRFAQCTSTPAPDPDPDPEPDPDPTPEPALTDTAITIRLDPQSCSTWPYKYLYYWVDEGSDGPSISWPGVEITPDIDRWYSYTFDSNVSKVNIIWTNGMGDQTIEITDVSESTCYALNSQSGTTIAVSVVDCPEPRAVSGKYKIGDLYYKLDGTNKTAEVTYKNQDWGTWDITIANIPSVVEYNHVKYSVTSIGETAFYRCYNLTSVIIPNSVKQIEGYAFTYCSNLTSAVIGDSVTSIGNVAFSQCHSLQSLNIPSGLQSLGSAVFMNCDGLTSIVVDPTNTVFDSRNNCNAIIETATNTLIVGCQNTVIPNSIVGIGDNAFRGSNLTSIIIPDSVTSIGDYAFIDCNSLSSIVISNVNTIFGEGVFYRCNSLPVIDNIRYADKYLVRVVDRYQTSYTIREETIWLGDSAFANCNTMNSIHIPESVIGVGHDVFSGCSHLPVIDNVEYADTYAVTAMDNYTTYTIKEGTKWIGEKAFYNTPNIKNHSNLVSVNIPSGVKTIGERAFACCTNLTSVIIPNSVTRIKKNAFYECRNLTSITLPDSLLRIDYGCFDLSGLTHVEIPNRVKIIEDYAFWQCRNIESVIIGESVERIGFQAFSGNDWTLRSVTFKPTTPPTMSSPFYGCDSLSSVYVPCGKVDAYKAVLGSRLSKKVKNDPSPFSVSTISENGTVSIPEYTICDEEIEMTVIPDTGYHFVRWSDGITENPRIITLTQDTTFTAELAINIYTLSVSCDEQYGSVTAVNGEFEHGSEHTIAAEPVANYHFVRWSDGNKENPRTIVLTKNTVLSAEFAINRYRLSVSCNSKQGSIEGNVGMFDYGSELTFKAVAKEGYYFTQWSDSVIDNPRTIILTQDTAFTAEFAVNIYLVQFFGFNDELLDSQSVEHGSSATAPKAPTVEHYDFVGWDKEFSNVTSDLDVHAIYEPSFDGIEDIQINGTTPRKILIDNIIYILRGDKVYTLQGQEVR